jgi:nucleoid-associated protein YgaU
MFGRKLLHILALAGAVLVVWSIAARPSGAHGPKTVYRVKAYDTLWTIAAAHYGGDVRNAIWEIQHTNHLAGSEITPGERLVLP